MRFSDLLVLIGSKGADKWQARAGGVSLSFDRKQYHIPTYQAEFAASTDPMLGIPGWHRHSVFSSTLEHVCHWLAEEGQGSVLEKASWELIEAA